MGQVEEEARATEGKRIFGNFQVIEKCAISRRETQVTGAFLCFCCFQCFEVLTGLRGWIEADKLK